MHESLTHPSPLLDFAEPAVQTLIDARGWRALPVEHRIGAIHDFVRNEIAFGYNRDDALTASQVLADGYGQCNTKAILLMALLRATGIACRLHGFTIDKALQRGVVPEAVYGLAPAEIIHSWVEVWHDGRWVVLEGFIIDDAMLGAIQSHFGDRQRLCAYGIGTDALQDPPVHWRGNDTLIQSTGIARDLGVHDTPDAFYAQHRQSLGNLRGWLYRHLIRHWMNARVRAMREQRLPLLPPDALDEAPARLAAGKQTARTALAADACSAANVSAPGDDDACGCHGNPVFDGLDGRYRLMLWIVIAINAVMFGVEIVAGHLAGSQALKADALDFLGDTLTYGMSLAVIGRAMSVRASAAMIKGLSLAAMGLWVFTSTLISIFGSGLPEAPVMGAVGLLALLANLTSVLLLMRYADGDANVRSVWLCSRNDAIGNVAVMIAGALVGLSGSRWPDLLVALVMAGLFLRSAQLILRQAWGEWRSVRQRGGHEACALEAHQDPPIGHDWR
ncbi:MAG: transglutaminase domain-containing protein [Burkholderiaceae bacterium]